MIVNSPKSCLALEKVTDRFEHLEIATLIAVSMSKAGETPEWYEFVNNHEVYEVLVARQALNFRTCQCL